VDQVNKRLDRLDHHVFGNGNPGLDETVRRLLERDTEVQRMLKEWEGTKNQLRGAKTAIITVGLAVSLLGGGLGLTILEALRRLAAEMP